MTNLAAVSNGLNKPPYYNIDVNPVPSVPRNRILIKTVAVAVNPTDWKHHFFSRGEKGSVVGSDLSGIVEEIGEDVIGFEKGDYVGSWLHGNFKPGVGAFQNYVVVDPIGTIKFDNQHFTSAPLDVGLAALEPVSSFEGAASIPLGLSTVGLSFSTNLQLDANNVSNKDDFILVWGGASATGILAIQIAKQVYGLKVIATSSENNKEYVKSLGADFVVDYKADHAVDQIKQIVKGKIRYVLDTISTTETLQRSYDSTEGSPKVFIDILSIAIPKDFKEVPSRRASVKLTKTIAYHIFGPVTHYGPTILQPELDAYVEFWNNLLPKVLGTLKTARLRVLERGLESASEALALLQNNKVSGEKVVFRI